MFPSLSTVTSSRARYCTIQDRGDVWPAPLASPRYMPDFGTLAEGLLPGHKVATDTGWRPVEQVCPGDMVLTFEHGMQPVVDVVIIPVAPVSRAAQAVRLVDLPAGAVGNRAPMQMLPGHEVLLDSPLAEARFGTPFVLVPAGCLAGQGGVTRTELRATVDARMLVFDNEELAHVNGAALLLCRGRCRPGSVPRRVRYQRLSPAQSEAVAHARADRDPLQLCAHV